MNKVSIVGTFKGVVVASVLALISPNTSWADDHLLSVNSGGGVTVSAQTPAVINHAGAVTTPLTFTFTGAPPPPPTTDTVTLGTSQTVTVVSTPVKMCKPGTRINKGQNPPVFQLEWLDQGNTVVGVTGTLTSGTTSTVPNNGYRLTLTMTGISDTYASSNGSCTVSGQKTFTYTAGALLERQTGGSGMFTTKLNSTYNFWNATNTVPEPGTVLLMLMGLLVLGWTSMKRMRTRRGISA